MEHSSNKNILFVCHEASRSGAPLVLLNLLKWLKLKNLYSFSILLQKGGSLSADFQQVGSTYTLNYIDQSRFIEKVKNKIIKVFLQKDKLPQIKLSSKLNSQNFDLIYLNTVVALDLALALKEIFKCPIISHIHENEFAVKLIFPSGLSQVNINAVEKFIAVSKNTKENLVTNYNIPEKKVTVINPFILVSERKDTTIPKSDIISELKFEDSFVVGGSGECNWRKGVDLFIQLSFVINKIRPDNNIKFLWLGNFGQEFASQKNYELKMLGLSSKVNFIGSKSNPQNYFQIFDVFALTSREDPFPLVALEAASMQKPVIFFDKAGGMSELFYNEKGGIKTAFGDVEEMAKAILKMYDYPEQKIQKGIEASIVVKDYDIDIIANKILNEIELVFSN